MKRNSFTLVELLVVIAIIAILAGALAPALMKAWSKSYVDQAKTEMAGFASIGTMIKLDTGYYVMLKDFDNTDGSKPTLRYDTGGSDDTYATTPISPALTDEQWDGPYTTFQSGKVTTSDTSNGTFSGSQLPSGTPTDPWGVPYGMCWDTGEDVMVIYCAGSDGTFQTSPGANTPSGDTDLIYKYK